MCNLTPSELLFRIAFRIALMGSLHEVSRRVAAFQRKTTNYKT
jgi:hypothetical protein